MDRLHVPSSRGPVCRAGHRGGVGSRSGLVVRDPVDRPSGEPPSVAVVLAVSDLVTHERHTRPLRQRQPGGHDRRWIISCCLYFSVFAFTSFFRLCFYVLYEVFQNSSHLWGHEILGRNQIQYSQYNETMTAILWSG